jgi:hypothetical protein
MNMARKVQIASVTMVRKALAGLVDFTMIGHQNRLPRIGGMATMPSRVHTFGTVLSSVLPQLDRLFVFFDKHEEVPKAFIDHSKVVPLLPSHFGALAGCGKFLGMELQGEPCLYFCFDDDILYPPDYVEFVTRALYRHRLQAIVGFHSSILKPPYLSYHRDRDVIYFADGLQFDRHVDVLGTGTSAFYTPNFRFDPRTWPYKDMADLLLAIEAAKQGLTRVSIQRPRNYLMPLELCQVDSIFNALVKNDSRQTQIMRAALKSCPLSWHMSPIESLE